MRVFPGFILLLAGSIAFGQFGNPINYTVEDGLSSNMVYGVVQDDRGFIWFGTDAGLSRFDGYEFKNYTLADGLPDTEILNFYKDSKGRIWMYTLNGKVGYIDGDSIYTSRNFPLLKELDFKGQILDIVEFEGKIYFHAKKSIIKILENHQTQKINSVQRRLSHSICMYQDLLFILTSDAFFVKEPFQYYERKQILKDTMYNISLTYPLCLGRKILLFDRHRGFKGMGILDTKTYHLKLFPETRFSIYNLRELEGQVIALTSVGVYKVYFEHDTPQYEDFHPVPDASSIILDRQGNHWVTSIKNGVYFYPASRIRINPKYTSCEALFNEPEHLYIGWGWKYVSQMDIHSNAQIIGSLPEDSPFYFVARDSSSNLWIGSDRGVFFNKKELSFMGKKAAFSAYDPAVFIVRVPPYGIAKIYLPFIQIESVWKYEGRIWDMEAISRDSLLIATDQGLFFKGKDSTGQIKIHSLLDVRIYEMAYHGNDLWLATDGNGLLRLNKEGAYQISINEGMTSDACTDLLVTDSLLWAVTPRGLHKLRLPVVAQPDITLITKEDGLPAYNINDIAYFNDSIYLAQDAGLVSFNVNEPFEEKLYMSPFIDQVKVGNAQVKDWKVNKDFLHDTEAIQITFKVLDYLHHGSLSYRHRLVSSGEKEGTTPWISSTDNKVTYSNMKPGEYEFQVKAKTKNSDWSPVAVYDFRIRPAYWQTLWFQLLVGTLLIGFSLVSYQWILNNRASRKRLAREKAVADIKALKAQINPHFFFNALNSIQSFILEDNRHVAQGYLLKYGQLMRRILDQSDELVIPLEEELETLRLYVDLEKLRSKHGFDFHVQLDRSIDPAAVLIPAMVLQPLVENAIWHGLNPLKKKGTITVSFSRKDEMIEGRIVDNGKGFDTEHVSSDRQSGIQLVKERLELLRNSKAGMRAFEIQSKPVKGTTVIIRFSKELYQN